MREVSNDTAGSYVSMSNILVQGICAFSLIQWFNMDMDPTLNFLWRRPSTGAFACMLFMVTFNTTFYK